MKRYKCPYCELREERDKLVRHVEDEHTDMIPQNYTANRVVFNLINKKDHGICVACKKPTDWDEDTCKYQRLHDNPKCAAILRKSYEKNMLKVYNKTTLLDDPEYQANKMLANRKISGTYTFSTGGSISYVGSFERKLLEHMDIVLRIKAKDIMAPGPTIEYEYNGKKLKWITDFLYIPYNLVIEVKDGGDNPNNRQMDSYREKQVAKEKMITAMGTYNYVRVTNNSLEQLWSIFAELKNQFLDDTSDNIRSIIRINEQTLHEMQVPMTPVGIRGSKPCVVQYGAKNTLADDEPEGFALTNDLLGDSLLMVDDYGNFIVDETASFLNGRKFTIYEFKGDIDRYKKILECAINKEKTDKNIYELLTDKEMITLDQIEYDDMFSSIDFADIVAEVTTDATSIIDKANRLMGCSIPSVGVFAIKDLNEKIEFIEKYGNLILEQDVYGYFARHPVTNRRTMSYENIRDINVKGLI